MDIVQDVIAPLAAKLGIALVGAVIAGVLIAVRGAGRFRVYRSVWTDERVEEIPDSDEGLGPAYRLRGSIPIRIATVASMSDSSDASMAEASRDEFWVVTAHGVRVSPKRSFIVERKSLFGSGSPDYGTLRVSVDKHFDRRFAVRVRAIGSAELLTPAVREALERLFRRSNVKRLELDETRTLRVSLRRGLTGGIGSAVAAAELLAHVASALGGVDAPMHRTPRTQTLDDSTFASNPGGVALDDTLLRALEPDLFKISLLDRLLPSRIAGKQLILTHIREHLMLGDSRAAIVVGVQPLVVAAYSDDLDCVALLEFPKSFQPPRPLPVGARVLTVNTYARIHEGVAADLVIGPRSSGAWGNFAPYIADLLSRDEEKIARRVASISESEWQRCAQLAVQTTLVRDGRPTRCCFPRGKGA